MNFSKILESDYGNETDLEFKYVMQDSANYYFGARFSYRGLCENELAPFKFRAVVEHYLAKDTDMETTLESHLYYMQPADFSCKTLRQLRAKVKINRMVEKKHWFRKNTVQYEEQILSVEEFSKMNLAQKKASGVIVRELIISKLALMSFSV